MGQMPFLSQSTVLKHWKKHKALTTTQKKHRSTGCILSLTNTGVLREAVAIQHSNAYYQIQYHQINTRQLRIADFAPCVMHYMHYLPPQPNSSVYGKAYGRGMSSVEGNAQRSGAEPLPSLRCLLLTVISWPLDPPYITYSPLVEKMTSTVIWIVMTRLHYICHNFWRTLPLHVAMLCSLSKRLIHVNLLLK